MGGLVGFIGLAVMLDNKPTSPAQPSSQVASSPVAHPVKSAASQWGCKANDTECASMAEKAEAEYQANGGDAHVKAEEEAFSRPEALAANEYFEKFMTAKKSGATQGELCHLLQVAHLGYVEAGAADEASNTHDWQVQFRCGS
jgi:ABC-type glycerol-3-phosphate transport system substrate-binding protein